MRRYRLFALTAFISCLSSARLMANDVLTANFGLFYFADTTKRNVQGQNGEETSLKTKTTYTFTSLGACYNMSTFCLGLKYLQGEIEGKSSSSNGTSVTTSTISGPGATLGYSAPDGLIAHLTYFLGAKKEVKASGEATAIYTASNAYLIELGYGFKISSVRIGPLLGIYNFTYNKVQQDGESSTLKPTEGDELLMPQLGLWVDL